MRKYLGLLLLIPIIFLSGCISQPSGQTGRPIGVVIKKFYPDVSEIYAGESVTFFVTVENIGEEDAEDVKAKLFGLGTDWGGEVGVEKEIGFLEKAVEENGGEGDAWWDVTAPSTIRGEYVDYPAQVRVSYKYKSHGQGILKVINSEYKRLHPEEAETSGAEFQATSAPVEIRLSGVAKPFIFREEGQTAYLEIKLGNIGQGKNYLEDLLDRKVRIDEITVNDQPCLNDIPQIVRLPREKGDYKTISCKFELPSVEEWTTIPIYVEVSYNYFVDDKTTIRVLRAE